MDILAAFFGDTVVIFIGDYFLQDYFASGLAQAAHRFLMIEHSVVLDDLR